MVGASCDRSVSLTTIEADHDASTDEYDGKRVILDCNKSCKYLSKRCISLTRRSSNAANNPTHQQSYRNDDPQQNTSKVWLNSKARWTSWNKRDSEFFKARK